MKGSLQAFDSHTFAEPLSHIDASGRRTNEKDF